MFIENLIINNLLDNSIKQFNQETPTENSFATQQKINCSEEETSFRQNNKSFKET